MKRSGKKEEAGSQHKTQRGSRREREIPARRRWEDLRTPRFGPRGAGWLRKGSAPSREEGSPLAHSLTHSLTEKGRPLEHKREERREKRETMVLSQNGSVPEWRHVPKMVGP